MAGDAVASVKPAKDYATRKRATFVEQLILSTTLPKCTIISVVALTSRWAAAEYTATPASKTNDERVELARQSATKDCEAPGSQENMMKCLDRSTLLGW